MPTLQQSFLKPSVGAISVPSFPVKEVTVAPYYYGKKDPQGFHILAISDNAEEHILASYGADASQNDLEQKIQAMKRELVCH